LNDRLFSTFTVSKVHCVICGSGLELQRNHEDYIEVLLPEKDMEERPEPKLCVHLGPEDFYSSAYCITCLTKITVLLGLRPEEINS
jgi:hypothetical protein